MTDEVYGFSMTSLLSVDEVYGFPMTSLLSVDEVYGFPMTSLLSVDEVYGFSMTSLLSVDEVYGFSMTSLLSVKCDDLKLLLFVFTNLSIFLKTRLILGFFSNSRCCSRHLFTRPK